MNTCSLIEEDGPPISILITTSTTKYKISRNKKMDLDIRVSTAMAIGDLVFTSTETDAVFLLLAHLPGFGKDDIKIQIDERRTEISISGGGQIESLDEVSILNQVNVAREVETGGFCRTFSIPDGVSFQLIDAEFDEDEEILVILMPKVAPAVAEQIEEKSEEVSCEGDKEQIEDMESFEPSKDDVDRQPEKEEEEGASRAPEPSGVPLEPIEKVKGDIDLSPFETLDSNEATEREQELQQEEEKVPEVEVPKEEEEEVEKVEDNRIPTAEVPDQLEPDKKLDEGEISTEEPPGSLEPGETMESELRIPSKLDDAHPEEEEKEEEEQGDQSREIDSAYPHEEQESTEKIPEKEMTDQNLEQEIPREQEPGTREQEVHPAAETADKVPEPETAEQEQLVQDQAPETAEPEPETAEQEQLIQDQAPEAASAEPQGRKDGRDLREEEQNAGRKDSRDDQKAPDQSSREDLDEEEETMKERNEMRRVRRRKKRQMPLPLTPPSLVAGSAFIFSLVALMFHLLKDKRRKPQQ